MAKNKKTSQTSLQLMFLFFSQYTQLRVNTY